MRVVSVAIVFFFTVLVTTCYARMVQAQVPNNPTIESVRTQLQALLADITDIETRLVTADKLQACENTVTNLQKSLRIAKKDRDEAMDTAAKLRTSIDEIKAVLASVEDQLAVAEEKADIYSHSFAATTSAFAQFGVVTHHETTGGKGHIGWEYPYWLIEARRQQEALTGSLPMAEPAMFDCDDPNYIYKDHCGIDVLETDS